MSQELAKTQQALEQVLVMGDLAKLSPGERTTYYGRVCASLGLNPLTKPFEYITLNGKLTLYARKDCADQLRRIYGVSIGEPTITFQDDWIVVTVSARLPDGRTDSDIGVVSRKDMRGDFGNALMKAVTKAKRRVTLSVCGLGMLDETEVSDIPTARAPDPEPAPAPRELPPAVEPASQPQPDKGEFLALMTRKGWQWGGVLKALDRHHGTNYVADKAEFGTVDPDHITRFSKWLAEQPDKPARTGPTPDTVFRLCEQVASAIDAKAEAVTAEVCARYGAGALDDLTGEQLADAVGFLNGQLPSNKIFEAGPELAKATR